MDSRDDFEGEFKEVDFRKDIEDLMNFHGISGYAVAYTTEDDVGYVADIGDDYYEMIGAIDLARFEMLMERHNQKLLGHDE